MFINTCIRWKRPTELREPELRGSGEDAWGGAAAAAAPPVDERRVAPELRAGAQQPRRQSLLGLSRLSGRLTFPSLDMFLRMYRAQYQKNASQTSYNVLQGGSI